MASHHWVQLIAPFVKGFSLRNGQSKGPRAACKKAHGCHGRGLVVVRFQRLVKPVAELPFPCWCRAGAKPRSVLPQRPLKERVLHLATMNIIADTIFASMLFLAERLAGRMPTLETGDLLS